MSRHEIEIEGLPEGFEPVKATYIGAALGKTETHTLALEIRRKARKYDWSKTLDDVLVTQRDSVGLFPLKIAALPHRLSEAWQPNIHGKCPVDGEACIVRVRFADGTCHEGIAAKFTWVLDGEFDDIIAYQFIRLADGYEW